LRVKLNKGTNDPSEIGKFFFTDYLDEEKDIVFERGGAFVVIDKDSLEAFTRMNLQMVDYVPDPENIARSRFLIRKKREW
jgi:Fe-S cluster assembly iron-binding protein IscA